MPSPLSPPPAMHLPSAGSLGYFRAGAGEVASASAAEAGAGSAVPGRQQQSLMQQLQQQARLREQQQQLQQLHPPQQPQQPAQLASAPQASGSPSPERRGGWAKLAGASRVPAGKAA